MLDRLLDVIGPVASDAAFVSGSQIVLGHSPIFREGLLGTDLQGKPVVLDRLLDVIGPVAKRSLGQAISQHHLQCCPKLCIFRWHKLQSPTAEQYIPWHVP